MDRRHHANLALFVQEYETALITHGARSQQRRPFFAHHDYKIHDRYHGKVQPVLCLRQACASLPHLSPAKCPSQRNEYQHVASPADVYRAQFAIREIQCVSLSLSLFSWHRWCYSAKIQLLTKGDTEDGKEMTFNCSKTNIKGLIEEVNRHSRQLQKAADLTA